MRLFAAVDGHAAEESSTEGRSVLDSTTGIVTKKEVFSRKWKGERRGEMDMEIREGRMG